MIEGLFEGGMGKALLVLGGVLIGVLSALLSRLGKRKADNIKRKTGGIL